MTITIRPATETDLPAILAIYNDAVLHTTASYDYEPATLDSRKAWYKAHQAQNLPIFVAEDETGAIAGWSSLNSFRAWAGYRFTVENSIYVASQWRGQGIGKQLLSPLISAAQESGLHAIVAGMDSENIASIRLHQSFGFESVAYFKEVGFKFDRWLDLIFMELIVSETHPRDE